MLSGLRTGQQVDIANDLSAGAGFKPALTIFSREMTEHTEKFLNASRDPFWQDVLRREALYLRRELAGDGRILDAGCGVGTMEALLADLDIVGLDSDPAMLHEA